MASTSTSSALTSSVSEHPVIKNFVHNLSVIFQSVDVTPNEPQKWKWDFCTNVCNATENGCKFVLNNLDIVFDGLKERLSERIVKREDVFTFFRYDNGIVVSFVVERTEGTLRVKGTAYMFSYLGVIKSFLETIYLLVKSEDATHQLAESVTQKTLDYLNNLSGEAFRALWTLVTGDVVNPQNGEIFGIVLTNPSGFVFRKDHGSKKTFVTVNAGVGSNRYIRSTVTFDAVALTASKTSSVLDNIAWNACAVLDITTPASVKKTPDHTFALHVCYVDTSCNLVETHKTLIVERMNKRVRTGHDVVLITNNPTYDFVYVNPDSDYLVAFKLLNDNGTVMMEGKILESSGLKTTVLILRKMFSMIRGGTVVEEPLPEYITKESLAYLHSVSHSLFEDLWDTITGDNSPRNDRIVGFWLSSFAGAYVVGKPVLNGKYLLGHTVSHKRTYVEVSFEKQTIRLFFDDDISPVTPAAATPVGIKDMSWCCSVLGALAETEVASTDVILQHVKRSVIRRTIDIHSVREDAPVERKLITSIVEILQGSETPEEKIDRITYLLILTMNKE